MLEDQPDAKQQVEDSHQRDQHTHRAEHSGIKGRGEIEVTGRPAHHLQGDQDHFEQEAEGRDIGGNLHRAPPPLHQSQQP